MWTTTKDLAYTRQSICYLTINLQSSVACTMRIDGMTCIGGQASYCLNLGKATGKSRNEETRNEMNCENNISHVIMCNGLMSIQLANCTLREITPEIWTSSDCNFAKRLYLCGHAQLANRTWRIWCSKESRANSILALAVHTISEVTRLNYFSEVTPLYLIFSGGSGRIWRWGLRA